MVLPQAMAWVQYWFRVLSLKFCGKSKKNCGDISQVSPAFCMYVYDDEKFDVLFISAFWRRYRYHLADTDQQSSGKKREFMFHKWQLHLPNYIQVTLNSSVNFVIYCIFGDKFKRCECLSSFTDLLCKHFCFIFMTFLLLLTSFSLTESSPTSFSQCSVSLARLSSLFQK